MQPSLETPRLLLRPFVIQDATTVQQLAGDYRVAASTLQIPHPYPDGAAEIWINSHPSLWEVGHSVTFAITDLRSSVLYGAIGLIIDAPEHQRAEMGYWIGVPYWGQGYCTEAAQALLNFAFSTLALNRVYAYHFVSNPASGHVLQKAGLQPEGCLRQHIFKWGIPQDVLLYGIVRQDWQPTIPILRP